MNKKLSIIMAPLLAITFLASCGGGDTPEPEIPIPLEECTWEKISEVSKAGKASEWFKIGDTKTVKVNNQNHKVRIIGFNQDKDKDGNNIGITFEFANLISDENGYSLATQWNDTNNDTTANHNYLDSSVRMALVGEKQKLGHILWAQKGNEHWSNEEGGPYTNKSVLDMLPDDLTKELKTPCKYININDDGWKEQVVNDKLFLLSPREMGFDTEHQESSPLTYAYYSGHTEAEDAIRIKKQVNEEIISTNFFRIPGGSGQEFNDRVSNHAGFNMKDGDILVGGYLWLRSSDTNDSRCAWHAIRGGIICSQGAFVYSDALSVAPAFCI